LLGGLLVDPNENDEATQDASQTQLSVRILGEISDVAASDTVTCHASSTSGRTSCRLPAFSVFLVDSYHIHCVAKNETVPGNETRIILNILCSCKSIPMKFST